MATKFELLGCRDPLCYDFANNQHYSVRDWDTQKMLNVKDLNCKTEIAVVF